MGDSRNCDTVRIGTRIRLVNGYAVGQVVNAAGGLARGVGGAVFSTEWWMTSRWILVTWDMLKSGRRGTKYEFLHATQETGDGRKHGAT